jgi:hypothetical protein
MFGGTTTVKRKLQCRRAGFLPKDFMPMIATTGNAKNCVHKPKRSYCFTQILLNCCHKPDGFGVKKLVFLWHNSARTGFSKAPQQTSFAV